MRVTPQEARHAKLRATLGVIISPIIPGLLLLPTAFIGGNSYYMKDAVILILGTCSLLGYIVAIVIGIPLYFFLKRRGSINFWVALISGVVLGCLAAFIFWTDQIINFGIAIIIEKRAIQLFILGPILGAVSTLTFWLFVKTKPTR